MKKTTGAAAAAVTAQPDRHAMSRVMLAWEGGAGRGHVVTLARVARSLAGVVACDAALGWMTHADEIAPWCEKVFPGVRLPYDRAGRKARGAPPAATWAEWLLDCGFADGDRMAARVSWWLDTFARRQTSLLIGDYAPCALMAARIAGIRALAIGTGYAIPPQGLDSFPVFLPEYPEREADEADLTARLNAALGPLGLPRLERLPDIYRRSGELVRTLAMLDPYRGQRSAPYLPPVADYAGPAGPDGDYAFCYFSTTELAQPGLVEALATCGLPLRGFLPGAPEDVVARLAAAGMVIEPRPLPVAEIGRSARLLCNSGQHGMVCLGLAAGLPQVCLPQHLEQLYVARQAEAAGVARVIWPMATPADAVRDTLRAAWHDAGASRRASELARSLAPAFVHDDGAILRQAIASWL
ncbi:MAG: hypothetical protein KDE15_14015 [Erythrobacter sp.]|nr:hypothetical protein [Erythrobacter sp.]